MDPGLIYEDVKRKIIWLELAPDSVLNLVELAEAYGVSRNPITILLNRLEAEGWLIRHGSHFVVPPLTVDSIRELTEIRSVLEIQANLWAMNRIGDQGLSDLDELQNKIESLPENSSKVEILQLDLQFHHIIFRETKNRQLAHYLEWLLCQHIRFWLSGTQPLDPRALNVDTLEIIRAIREKDEISLRAATTSHIKFSLDKILGLSRMAQSVCRKTFSASSGEAPLESRRDSEPQTMAEIHADRIHQERSSHMSRKLMVIFMAIGFLLCCSSFSLAEPLKLKFGAYEPATGFVATKCFQPWIDQVNADSKGLIHITYYGGTLGRDPMQQLKLLLDGVTDFTLVPYPYHPGRFPEITVTNVPFVANTSLEGSLASFKMYESKMFSGFDDLVVANLIVQPQFTLHTNFPVKSPGDLKGKKIRTAGKMQQVLVEAAGASAIAIPISEVAENISRGVCDGTVCEWVGQNTFRINDVTKYHIDVSFGGNIMGVAMSKKRYDALPADVKAVLDKHMGFPFSVEMAKAWDAYNTEWNEKISKDPHHQLIKLTDADKKVWQDLFAPVVEGWVGENPKNAKLLETYKTEVSNARK